MFTGRWKRKEDQELEEDEWFIPYNRRSAPPLPGSSSKGGIGEMPLASGSGTALQPPTSGREHLRQRSADVDNLARRFFPRRPLFPRSGSDGSLTRMPGHAERLPSDTSVPTGLAAPKMLFSPISREIRNDTRTQPRYIHPGPVAPRTRAVSMPKQRQPPTSHMYDRVDPSRWAAPTMCDLLVFPRPQITAHTITPPHSPGQVTNAFDGLSVTEKVDREKERDEWHRYVEKKARSRSFRIGRSSKEEARDGEEGAERHLFRRDTAKSRLNANAKGRSRSASVGDTNPNSNPSRKTSRAKSGKSRREEDGQGEGPRQWVLPGQKDYSIKGRSSHGHEDMEDDPFEHKQVTEAERYRRAHHHRQQSMRSGQTTVRSGHQHSKSTPDLMSISSQPRNTSSRFPPSPIPDDGVIIIGPGDAVKSPPTPRKDTQYPLSPDRPDFSKPLPPLPAEYRLHYNPSSPFKPFGANASRDPSFARLPPTGSSLRPVESTSKVNDDDPFLARSDTSTTPKPKQESTTPAPLSPADARVMIARQHQRAINKRAFNSPRPHQRDPATPGPSGTSVTSSVYSQSTRRTSNMSAVSPLRRLTAMEEAIVRSRASTMSGPVPERKSSLTHSVFDTTAAHSRSSTSDSTATASTARPLSGSMLVPRNEGTSQTTPRMRTGSAASETPSPRNANHEDFKGLFFRTPREQQVMRFNPSSQTMPSQFSDKLMAHHAASGHGLGFDLDDERRQSNSDDSTVEVSTPTTGNGPRGYLDYGETVVIPATIKEPIEAQPLSASFQNASADTSPASQHDGSDDEDSDDYVIRHAPIHPVVQIGTPKGSDIAANKRRSVVPSVGDSLNSLSTFCVDDNEQFENQGLSVNHALVNNHGHSSHSLERHLSRASTGHHGRDSTAVSFIDDFPSPPNFAEPSFISTAATMPAPPKHSTAFGQLVTGPPGAGKTTYCHGMHQFLTALDRPVHIINLDPAVPEPPYPCAINITSLITLEQVMEEYGLGPNGAMLYCIEYLEANFDWLVEELDNLLGEGGDGYVIFDTPGQVELWTNHDSLKNVVEKLQKMDYRLAAVHLSDAHYVVDASKFISVVLLALRAMMQLELPHINVLSKIDLLSTYGELPFDLRYYTEVQDMSYLLDSLDKQDRMGKFRGLNKAMVELVEEYGLVGFETLAVEDKTSMMKLLRQLDKATGYIYVPSSSTSEPNSYGLFSTAQSQGYLGDIDDVQERWIDNKETWDEREKEEWKKEGEMRAASGAGGGTRTEEEIDEGAGEKGEAL